MKRLLAVLTALAVSSCATPQSVRPDISTDAVKSEALAQQRYVIDQRLSEARRVSQIHRTLSLANLEFCKKKSKSIGISIQTRDQYGKAFKSAAEAVGLSGTPSIGFVLANSPASAAGLLAGDKFVAVNGAAVESKSRGAREIEKTIADWKEPGAIPITVQRGTQTQTFSVTPQELCGYSIAVIEADEANAYADGRSIVLNRRILSLAESDDQLALVIGHELAHNALGHLDARRTNQAIGMIGGALLDLAVAAAGGGVSSEFTRLGGAAGAGAYSKQFESEADYAGMYFIARANYSLDNVENVWRRFAVDYPSGINFGGTHPTTPERYVAIAAARTEIRAAQAAGLPLRPHMKGDKPQAAEATKPSANPPASSPESAGASAARVTPAVAKASPTAP